jgi:hypothetical protein
MGPKKTLRPIPPRRVEEFHKEIFPPRKALIRMPDRKTFPSKKALLPVPPRWKVQNIPNMALATKKPWVPKDERPGGRFEKLPVLSREDRHTKRSEKKAMVQPSSLLSLCRPTRHPTRAAPPLWSTLACKL